MKQTRETRYTETICGFLWGPMEVTREATLRRNYCILGIETKRQYAQIHVTPSGLIRVFVRARKKECGR